MQENIILNPLLFSYQQTFSVFCLFFSFAMKAAKVDDDEHALWHKMFIDACIICV